MIRLNGAGFFSGTFQFNFRMLSTKFLRSQELFGMGIPLKKRKNGEFLSKQFYKMVAMEEENQNNLWFDFNYYFHCDVNISVADTWNILNYH